MGFLLRGKDRLIRFLHRALDGGAECAGVSRRFGEIIRNLRILLRHAQHFDIGAARRSGINHGKQPVIAGNQPSEFEHAEKLRLLLGLPHRVLPNALGVCRRALRRFLRDLRRFRLSGRRIDRRGLGAFWGRRGCYHALAQFAFQLVHAGDERFHLQAFFRRARAKGGGFQREARLGCPFHIRFACQKEIEHAHQPRVRRAPGLRNVFCRVLVRDL